VFTVALLFAGLGLILLGATDIARSVVGGELQRLLGQFRRSRMIERMSGHDIVCGWGRMGQAVVEELRRASAPSWRSSATPIRYRRLEQVGIPAVAGDATEEEISASRRCGARARARRLPERRRS